MSESNAGAPKEARLGTGLAVFSLVLGAIKGVLLPVPGPLWIAMTVLAILAALVFAVAKGFNWARIAFLVLFLLGLPSLYFVRESLLQEGVPSLVILLAQTAVQFAALVLWFLPTSNAWFRQRVIVKSTASSQG
ncbi:MAG: hypothetical protein U1B84_08290 [Variovorax sp.]|nr:hypothetical protein [Variovorax sp.]